MIKTLIDSTLVHVGSAFLLMGAWAFWANHDHGTEKALIAALVQGTLSASITFFMKKALEALSAYFKAKDKSLLCLIGPPLIACSVSLCVLVSIHILARTPEIFATIALPFTTAFSYACFYSTRLWMKAYGKNT